MLFRDLLSVGRSIYDFITAGFEVPKRLWPSAARECIWIARLIWLSEADLDIDFSVQEGYHQVVCRRGQRKMSWSFTAPQAGKLTLSWDNGHSWVRSKHLNYYLEVLPEEAHAAATKRLETATMEKSRQFHASRK